MSALHGPIPLIAVSAACASSAGRSASASMSRPPRTASVTARMVRIFGAERPVARSAGSSDGGDRRRRQLGQAGIDAPPDRFGACRRQLLADDDMEQPLEAGRAPPHRHLAGHGDHRHEPRLDGGEMRQPFFDVGFRFDDTHDRRLDGFHG